MGRTGAFICLHAQMERLKTEGVIDCFQFIKSARLNRPGLVQNVVSMWDTHSLALFFEHLPTCPIAWFLTLAV